MNEMMYMPLMWVIILVTAVLSSIVTTALPYVPKWWDAFKNVIKRKKNTKPAIDATAYFNLQEQIDELKEQLDNVAKNHYRRETNRKNNIRKAVREYLKELQND